MIAGCSEVSPQPLPSPQKSPPHATQQTSQNVYILVLLYYYSGQELYRISSKFGTKIITIEPCPNFRGKYSNSSCTSIPIY